MGTRPPTTCRSPSPLKALDGLKSPERPQRSPEGSSSRIQLLQVTASACGISTYTDLLRAYRLQGRLSALLCGLAETLAFPPDAPTFHWTLLHVCLVFLFSGELQSSSCHSHMQNLAFQSMLTDAKGREMKTCVTVSASIRSSSGTVMSSSWLRVVNTVQETWM